MNQLAILVVVISTIFVVLPLDEASATKCAKWVKLNKSPVCFGARDDKYGSFTYTDQNIFVKTFMLVHRSGNVTCTVPYLNYFSFWGCQAGTSPLGAILTDNQNQILGPEAETVSSVGAYTLPGYTSSSSILVFCTKTKPLSILRNMELRLWYGEDLSGSTESDNAGQTCPDVFALLD